MFKKIVLWFLVIAVVLIAVLLIAINPILGWSTTKTFNKLAPEITGTATHVEKVDFSVYQGRVEVDNFVVGNPQGFTTPTAFTVDEFVIELNPSSLLTDTILVEEISIIEPKFTLEHVGTKVNLLELKNQIEANAKPADASAKSAEPEAKAAEPKAKKKIAVRKVKLKDAEVQLVSQGKVTTIKLPDIEFDDFAPEGVSAAQLSVRLTEKVLPKVLEQSQQGALKGLGQQLLNLF